MTIANEVTESGTFISVNLMERFQELVRLRRSFELKPPKMGICIAIFQVVISPAAASICSHDPEEY